MRPLTHAPSATQVRNGLVGSRASVKEFLKKLGSDLVVQSSRYGYPEQNFALYHLGIVPGLFIGFHGGSSGPDFYVSWGGQKSAEKKSQKKVAPDHFEMIIP